MADFVPRFQRNRHVGSAFRRSYERRIDDGFMTKYFSGAHILDIGYQGGDPNSLPVTDWAIGVGLDYPGYDGTHLPFADLSQDTIVASHVLEHILNYQDVLAEWYRVLAIGGYLVLLLPHRYLYEKRPDLPSLRNSDHHRFYTPASLLSELDESLPVNGFRIRHLYENDEGYNYGDAISGEPFGCYDIDLVVEKIARPDYSDSLTYSEAMQNMVDNFDRMVVGTVAALLAGDPAVELFRRVVGSSQYLTPWHRLRQHFLNSRAAGHEGRSVTEQELKDAVRPLLEFVEIDSAGYVALHPDLINSEDPLAHWRAVGYFEGRATRDLGLMVHDIARAGKRPRSVDG